MKEADEGGQRLDKSTIAGYCVVGVFSMAAGVGLMGFLQRSSAQRRVADAPQPIDAVQLKAGLPNAGLPADRLPHAAPESASDVAADRLPKLDLPFVSRGHKAAVAPAPAAPPEGSDQGQPEVLPEDSVSRGSVLNAGRPGDGLGGPGSSGAAPKLKGLASMGRLQRFPTMGRRGLGQRQGAPKQAFSGAALRARLNSLFGEPSGAIKGPFIGAGRGQPAIGAAAGGGLQAAGGNAAGAGAKSGGLLPLAAPPPVAPPVENDPGPMIFPPEGVFNTKAANTLDFTVFHVGPGKTALCVEVQACPCENCASSVSPEDYCNNPANYSKFEDASGSWSYDKKTYAWSFSLPFDEQQWGCPGMRTHFVFRDKKTTLSAEGLLRVTDGVNGGPVGQDFSFKPLPPPK